MTKLHSHLKRGFISILSLTLIFSNMSVYALDDTSNIIIEEDDINETNMNEDTSSDNVIIEDENINSEEENNNITTIEENINNKGNFSNEDVNNDVNSIELYSNNEGIATCSVGSFDITLTPNTSGYGSVSLDWKKYNYADKNFKVYKSSNGGKTFETVGIDYKSVKEVKLLQVYPHDSAQNQFSTWMTTNGYGKGIIKVNSVSLDEFNKNPNSYLKNSSGNWKYNVIFFGTWDANNYKDLSTASKNATKAFIKAGGGAIFGHDTIINDALSHPNFNAFASDVGVRLVNGTTDMNADTKVVIKKKGLFTNYPWTIGDVGKVLTIPAAHTLGQVVSGGTSYLEFSNGGSYNSGNVRAPSYLTVKNNCALIMTGHSNGAATTDEQKILANLIFYCNQLIFNTYCTNDSSAQDVAKPNKPSVSINNDNFNWSATDNGSTYYYYVESYDKNDTTSSGLLDKSTTKSLTITTGVKSYRYILDNEEKTKVTTSTGTSTTNTSLKIDSSKKYLHIIAIDGAGNVSDTTTYEIPQTISLTTSIIWNDNNNKNGFRPSKYTLKLMRNDTLFKQMELASSQTSYTFSDLTKYDSNGNAFKYTFQVDASDRYKISLDENGNTITENYQNSTFSVIIPKTISLNGNTGTCSYKVTVSGTFYYNDTLTVIPSSSFTLKDGSGISTLQANVTQNVTTFTKDNLGTTSGSISLNKTKFAGKYDGTFNFNIKFTLKN